jgi:hypothetical protein
MWAIVDLPHALEPLVGVLEPAVRDESGVRCEHVDRAMAVLCGPDELDDGGLVANIEPDAGAIDLRCDALRTGCVQIGSHYMTRPPRSHLPGHGGADPRRGPGDDDEFARDLHGRRL